MTRYYFHDRCSKGQRIDAFKGKFLFFINVLGGVLNRLLTNCAALYSKSMLEILYLFPFSRSRATIDLGDVTPHNLQQLKRLNQVVFPVSYNDKFYKDILEAGELAKLGKREKKRTY